MEIFKNRTVWFYVAVAAALSAFVADIVFIAVSADSEEFSAVTFAFLLAAVAAQGAYVFFRGMKFLPAVSAACYAVSVGAHLYQGLPVLSDVVNQVNFVGGNPVAAVAFGVIFLVCAVAGCAVCFTEQNKTAA